MFEQTFPGLAGFQRRGMSADYERFLGSWQSSPGQMVGSEKTKISGLLSSTATRDNDYISFFSLKVVNRIDCHILKGFSPTSKK